MNRRGTTMAAAVLMLAIAGAAFAQVDKSKEVIPFLTGDAAALAGKMLAICGGTSGISRMNVIVQHAPASTELTLVVGGIPRVGVVTTSNGAAKFVLKSVPAPGSQLLDFDPRGRVVAVQNPG